MKRLASPLKLRIIARYWPVLVILQVFIPYFWVGFGRPRMWPITEALAKGTDISDPFSGVSKRTANGTVREWGRILAELEVRVSELEAGRHEEPGSLEAQQAKIIMAGPESRSVR
jgi:hypothetical protein